MSKFELPQVDPEIAGLQERMRRHLADVISEVMVQREEILRAFVAKHGFHPDEAEQIIQDMPDGSKRWWIQKRRDVEG